MLSAVIATRHSYPAVPLAGQLVDQRSVHPGPLVASSPVSRSADYIFIRSHIGTKDDGILPIGAVILYGMIPQPTSPRVFQRKSLRGTTEVGRRAQYSIVALDECVERNHLPPATSPDLRSAFAVHKLMSF